jgi:hypothetical protein
MRLMIRRSSPKRAMTRSGPPGHLMRGTFTRQSAYQNQRFRQGEESVQFYRSSKMNIKPAFLIISQKHFLFMFMLCVENIPILVYDDYEMKNIRT